MKTTRNKEVCHLINNRTFLQFCNELNGYDVINPRNGHQVYRWQLYWNGIKAEELKAGRTNFKLKIR